MSDQPTFAGLKERWREKVSPYNHNAEDGVLLDEGFKFGRTSCADDLEALEQRVRELREYALAEGSKGYALDCERIADKLTALLGDKP